MVNPDNVSEIVNAMNRLQKDINLRKKLITKGKHLARNFTWEKTSKETARIYNQVLGS